MEGVHDYFLGQIVGVNHTAVHEVQCVVNNGHVGQARVFVERGQDATLLQRRAVAIYLA